MPNGFTDKANFEVLRLCYLLTNAVAFAP